MQITSIFGSVQIGVMIVIWSSNNKLCRHHKSCIDDDCLKACQDWKQFDEFGKSLCVFVDTTIPVEEEPKQTEEKTKKRRHICLNDDDISLLPSPFCILLIVIAFMIGMFCLFDGMYIGAALMFLYDINAIWGFFAMFCHLE